MYKTLPRFDPGTSRVGIPNATTELLPLPNNHIVKNFYLKRRQFFDKFSSNAIVYTNEKMNIVSYLKKKLHLSVLEALSFISQLK